MMNETIVAVFDSATQAEAAVAELVSAGVPASAIARHAGTTSTGPVREQGFWARLFGGEPDGDAGIYDRSVQGGSSVVTVNVADAHVSRVMSILESHNPVDLDERATGYGIAATSTATPAATAADQTISLSEERLAVGKRLVNQGGTRVRRFVVETPVVQQVNLHQERVVVERRPVTDGRPVANADFSDRMIEMTETAEEAVIAKTAHVVEEIRLHKDVSTRTETVRDTVRREDVEIEEIGGATDTLHPAVPHAPEI